MMNGVPAPSFSRLPIRPFSLSRIAGSALPAGGVPRIMLGDCIGASTGGGILIVDEHALRAVRERLLARVDHRVDERDDVGRRPRVRRNPRRYSGNSVK